MFIEESIWIRERLAELDLPPGAGVLDIGSSTGEFRTSVQPHIDRNVFAPLRERGLEIVHMDAKQDEGVDAVVDLNDPSAEPGVALGRRFDLVLCTNLLEHVENRGRVVRRVVDLVDDGGRLVVTVPQAYRRHLDPIDTMFRPRPRTLVRLFRAHEPGLKVVAANSVPIRERSSYQYHASRFVLRRKREMIRYRVPPLRWKQACVLFER